MALAIYHTGQAAIAQPRTLFHLLPSDRRTAGKRAASDWWCGTCAARLHSYSAL